MYKMASNLVSIRRRAEKEPQNVSNLGGKAENKVYSSILELVGNTPLVKLNKVPKDHGVQCEIYAKCEFLNPSGSIKDRIALGMIQDARQKGFVDDHTEYVEATSGNTGIGIAFNAALTENKCIIVTEDKNSSEKVNTINLLGAEVIQTKNKELEFSIARQLKDENPKTVVMLNQFDNPVNPRIHYENTAEEILAVLSDVDVVVMGTGTGGTMTGVSKKLKEKNPKCIVVVTEPNGSIMHNTMGKSHPFLFDNPVNPRIHYENTAEEILAVLSDVDVVVMGTGTGGTMTGVSKKLKEKNPKCIVVVTEPNGSIMHNTMGKSHPFLVEGIGGSFIPIVCEESLIDHFEVVTDQEAFLMSRELAKKEGLLCGGSSGSAMAAAIKAVKTLNIGAGKRVVVILPDGIRNYMSKFVSDQWMEAHRFMEPPEHSMKWWKKPITEIHLSRTYPKLNKDSTCEQALQAMKTNNVNIAVIVDDVGHFVGALSKDNLRNRATNPTKLPGQDSENFDFEDVVFENLDKHVFTLAKNAKAGNPTVGLLSRMLDITPYVIIGKDGYAIKRGDSDFFIPSGVVTGDDVLDYIHEHSQP